MRPSALVTVALPLALISCPNAQAWEGDTVRIGGPGGAEFHDSCKAGEAVVGMAYQAGKDLNSLRITCQPLRDGMTDGHPYDRGSWGTYDENGHGSSQGAILCPAPMVVQAIFASQSSAHVVHDFWLLCRNLTTGEHHQSEWSATQGGRGGRPGNADCGDDSYAVGIWGGYGSLVDAVGLICTVYRPAPPPPPPQPNQPDPPPRPDKPALPVDNGTGDGNMVTSTDTTIYDQPAGNEIGYLGAGDPVAVSACEADNWCHIVRPQDGWVWSDDLQR